MWQKSPPNVGRRQPQDIIRQAPGITNVVNCTSPVEAFGLFITPTMIDLLVLETNREARQQVTARNETNPDNPKTWLALDSNEMKAFIGLCILAGVYKSNHEPVAYFGQRKKEDLSLVPPSCELGSPPFWSTLDLTTVLLLLKGRQPTN